MLNMSPPPLLPLAGSASREAGSQLGATGLPSSSSLASSRSSGRASCTTMKRHEKGWGVGRQRGIAKKSGEGRREGERVRQGKVCVCGGGGEGERVIPLLPLLFLLFLLFLFSATAPKTIKSIKENNRAGAGANPKRSKQKTHTRITKNDRRARKPESRNESRRLLR